MKAKAELVLAADVRQEASRLARQVRDLLLIIPNRLAAKLAGMTDQDQVRSELQAEIESALRGLADA
jgi:phage terminase Nu1 subunit (DNA packaging protein)